MKNQHPITPRRASKYLKPLGKQISFKKKKRVVVVLGITKFPSLSITKRKLFLNLEDDDDEVLSLASPGLGSAWTQNML